MSGKVVHFELPFDDGDRARTFYAEAFGWKLDPMPEFDYTGISTGPMSEDMGPSEPGYIGGGMTSRTAPVESPVITIETASIEDTLAKVAELGGSTVASKQAVGDMGFTAYFKDSEGNVVGLWENAAPAEG